MKCFEHDVFLSYGWLDDERFGPAEEKWMEAFSARLRVRLSELIGRHAILWSDVQSLKGNQLIWPAIRRGITESAIFLSIISPRCVSSPYCRMERQHFQLVRLLRGGPAIDSRARAFHAVKLPVAA